jgi:hypothetical protein
MLKPRRSVLRAVTKKCSFSSICVHELMQMRIRPAEDRLNHMVKTGEANRAWHVNATPNRRSNTLQGDFRNDRSAHRSSHALRAGRQFARPALLR